MPEYEFENEKGEIETVVMAMADAPQIGSVIEHDGRALRRIASDSLISNGGFVPFTAFSQGVGDPAAKKFGEGGHPRFDSKKDIAEYVDRRNGGGQPLEWNGQK